MNTSSFKQMILYFIILHVLCTCVRCQHNQYNENQGFLLNGFNQAQDNLDNNDNEDNQQYGAGSSQSFSIIASSSSSEAAGGPASSANQLAYQNQCEQVNFDFCSSMPFNYTRMPNIFGDKNQIEASERSQQYKPLVQSGCSGHLLAYLCELLAPICFNDENMKKFVIYPCRSFCRSVKQDCEHELMSLFYQVGGSLPKAFDCDILPFETQSNSSKLHGPCHETPTSLKSTRLSHKDPTLTNNNNNYWPYKPESQQNIPPFITDTSGLDFSLLKQPKKTPNEDKTTFVSNNSNFWEAGQQLQSLGQSIWVTFLKYSNTISIVSLLCLLVILKTRRLQRLYLFDCFSSSRNSSSSSASSNSSQRKLAANSSLSGYPSMGPKGNQINVHKVAMSPSSSSRSLMLFAGGSGKPQSKLVDANELMMNQAQDCVGPQKLQLHHLHQKTLIDVTGTFERLKKHQDRYQQLVKQQQQQQQHEYDYIQVQSSTPSSSTAAGGQQSNQMYRNILLSSPSHQVLLCGTGERHQVDPLGPAPPPPPSNATISHLARQQQHYISPYASPLAANFNQQQPQQMLFEPNQNHQMSFSRRTRSSRNSVGQSHAYAASSSSAASSSGASSSSGNSSTSSFSPTAANLAGVAGGQLPVPSPRRL